MRTTDSAKSRTAQVVRVSIRLQKHLARGLVHRVIGFDEFQIRQGQQRGDVGVVHENVRAITVDLKCVHLTVGGMVHNAVLLHSLTEVVGPDAQIIDEIHVSTGCFNCVGSLAQLNGHHGVGRDEEPEDGRVVTGSERTAIQTSALVEGVANAGQGQGLRPQGGLALESVHVADELVILVKSRLLLGVQQLQNRVQCLVPAVGQPLSRPGGVVELIAQRQESGQGIELVLALEDHRGVVRRVHGILLGVFSGLETAGRRRLEGIAVRRLNHKLSLRVDSAENELVEGLVRLCERLVRLQLVGAVTQPLSGDVAGHDERLSALPGLGDVALEVVPPLDLVGRSAVDVPGHGGVQGVWQRIGEQLREILVHQPGRHVGDDLLDGLGRKRAAFWRRTLVGELQRTITIRGTGRDAVSGLDSCGDGENEGTYCGT